MSKGLRKSGINKAVKDIQQKYVDRDYDPNAENPNKIITPKKPRIIIKSYEFKCTSTGKIWKTKSAALNVRDAIAKYQSTKKIAPIKIDILSQIFGTDPYDWSRVYNFIVLAAGQGSGKNYMFETGIAFVNWWVYNLEDPIGFFNQFLPRDGHLDEDSNLEVTNSSMVNQCVPTDTSEILTKSGWKKYNEINLGDIVLSYNLDTNENEWQSLQAIWIYEDIPIYELYSNYKHSFECTLAHKWVVQKASYKNISTGKISLRHPNGKPRGTYKNRKPDKFLCETKNLKGAYKILLSAKCFQGTNTSMTPDECSILGWVITDGTIRKKSGNENHFNYKGGNVRLCIYQSKERYLNEIRELVKSVDSKCYEVITKPRQRKFPHGRTYNCKEAHSFYMSSAYSKTLLEKAGLYDSLDKIVEFAISLNYECREAMLQSMMKAEAHWKNRKFAQKDRTKMDVFQILATLNGYALGNESKEEPVNVQILKKENYIACNALKRKYSRNGKVWCPTTVNGTWIMRQNGKIMITGNSQAQTVFFDRYKQNLRSWKSKYEDRNWFTKYIKMDLREKGLGDIRKDYIEFPKFGGADSNTGRMRIYSLDSKPESVEGKTILIGIGDELSRAEKKPEFIQASALVRVLRGNAATRFPRGIGKTILWSYYNNTDWDITYKFIDEEKKNRLNGIKTRTWIGEYSTYQMNPKVTREENADFYRNDPDDAQCRFDSIKHKSKNKFLSPYIFKMQDCMNADLVNRIKANYMQSFREGKSYSAIEVQSIKGDTKDRFFSADPGKTKDSFVITGGYAQELKLKYVDEVLKKDFNIESIDRKVITDFYLEWKPKPDCPVDYINVKNIILNVILPAFPNTKMFNFDIYNSESLRQEIEAQGIISKTYSFQRPMQTRMYKLWRIAVFNNLWEYLPSQVICSEGEGLIMEGTKVDHDPQGRKDAMDTIIVHYSDIINATNIGIVGLGMDRFTDIQLYKMLDRFILEMHIGKQQGLMDQKLIEHISRNLNITHKEDFDMLLELQKEHGWE